MKELYEYLHAILLLSPLFFFIIAVAFRLLDNSGYLFLKREIIIESSYVSRAVLKKYIHNTSDRKFKRKLKLVLLYRRMHRLFLIFMVLSLPLTVWCYFYLY